MSTSDVVFFMTMRSQLKLYHWTTHAYSRHKATDKAIDLLDELIDQFVEVYIGVARTRPDLDNLRCLRVTSMNEDEIEVFLDACIQYLTERVNTHSSTDLKNIRDEMLAVLHRLRYLFTLR